MLGEPRRNQVECPEVRKSLTALHVDPMHKTRLQTSVTSSQLSSPQVEKVCGPLAAGPMTTSRQATTSATPATSATSQRSSRTPSPSVRPGDHPRLQLQSQRSVHVCPFCPGGGGSPEVM